MTTEALISDDHLGQVLYRESLRSDGVPDEVIDTLIENFSSAAARGDTIPTGVVEEILERPGREFSTYAREAAARGAWQAVRAR